MHWLRELGGWIGGFHQSLLLQAAVVVDLEGHGREDVFDDVDLARTVGWFTRLFPVRLDPGAVDWVVGQFESSSALRLVKAMAHA